MKQLLILVAILAASAASAQNPATPPGVRTRDDRLEQLIREWQLESQTSPWRNQVLERQAADRRRREFVEKANRVATLWKKVMARFMETGTFNVKEARELSKAFRDLEATGWPK